MVICTLFLQLKSLFGNNEEKYDPWGKGTGAPRRDSRGNVERYKISDPGMGIQTNINETQNQVSEETYLTFVETTLKEYFLLTTTNANRSF